MQIIWAAPCCGWSSIAARRALVVRGVEENRAALEESLCPAVCDVLLDESGLERLRLLLQHALPAGVEGAEEAGALHLPDLGRVLEIALHALKVLAPGHAARMLE